MFGPRARNRLRRNERAVSPVIGTVLILVIMIFSIAGILAWGVPAIQGLQDRAEFQNVLTQFLQMDAQVRNLRDPQNTRVITIAQSQGELHFTKGERWVISAARRADYDDYYLSGWEGSNPASVTISGISVAGKEISVDLVTAGSILNRFSCTGCNPVSLGTAPNNILLNDQVARVTVKEGGNVMAESWIMNMGRISYYQSSLNELNWLHFSMGAVFSQQNNAFFVEEAPTLKDPDYTLEPEDVNLFIRAIQLTGSAASSGGEGRRPIIFNLIDNYGPSRGRPSFDPATSTRIQVDGLLEVPFCNYLDQRANWEPLTACPDSGTAGNVNVRFVRPTDAENPPNLEALAYDLSQAVVMTTVRQQ